MSRPLTREQKQSRWLHAAIAGHMVTSPDTVLGRARANLDRFSAVHAGTMAAHWLRASLTHWGETPRSVWLGASRMVARMSSADYRDKSPEAGRMGKATEYLIAAACVLSTRGELNVSMSMVDDEGVDLVFHRRDGVATLAVQVKARMSDSKNIRDENMVAYVRSQTFRTRADLDILFVAVDIARGAVLKAWLIPSQDFAEVAGSPDPRGRLRFTASMKEGSQDRWASRRLDADQLAPAILARLRELEA